MRITLVISSLSGGGAERVMSILANHWAAHGREIVLITIDSKERDFYHLHPQIKRIGLDLLFPSRNFLLALLHNWRRWRLLRQNILNSQPEVVVSFLDCTNVLTILACIGRRIPVVISERTDPRQINIGWFWAALRRLTYPRARAVVVQTEAVRQWAESFIQHQAVFTIPNPVEPPFLPSENPPHPLPHGRLLVSMGRLGQEKGYDLLLQAFASCAGKHPDWSLVILGEGNQRAMLENLVKDLGLNSRVILPGQVSYPATILYHCDLFVLSSRREGFPNALLEAMAWGLPAVSFDCPSGPGEIIRHGLDGLLVPPQDVEALAATLNHLMSDEGERRRLAQRASEVLDRFGVSKIMRMWDELLGSLA